MKRKMMFIAVVLSLFLMLTIPSINAVNKNIIEKSTKNIENDYNNEILSGKKIFYGVHVESSGPGKIRPRWSSGFLGMITGIPIIAHWEGKSTILFGDAKTTVDGFLDYEISGDHEATALGSFDIRSNNGRYEISGLAICIIIKD